MLVLGGLAASPAGGGIALAQAPRNDPPTISADRIIGSPVYNEMNERIGTLEDVLVRPSGGEFRLVLSVGDLVGHDKMVAVPMNRIVVQDGRLTMAGGTKEALEKLSAFSYQDDNGSG